MRDYEFEPKSGRIFIRELRGSFYVREDERDGVTRVRFRTPEGVVKDAILLGDELVDEDREPVAWARQVPPLVLQAIQTMQLMPAALRAVGWLRTLQHPLAPRFADEIDAWTRRLPGLYVLDPACWSSSSPLLAAERKRVDEQKERVDAEQAAGVYEDLAREEAQATSLAVGAIERAIELAYAIHKLDHVAVRRLEKDLDWYASCAHVEYETIAYIKKLREGAA